MRGSRDQPQTVPNQNELPLRELHSFFVKVYTIGWRQTRRRGNGLVSCKALIYKLKEHNIIQLVHALA